RTGHDIPPLASWFGIVALLGASRKGGPRISFRGTAEPAPANAKARARRRLCRSSVFLRAPRPAALGSSCGLAVIDGESMLKCGFVLALVLCASSAHAAAYHRTGPIKAYICKGFVIEVCSSSVEVDAVSEDGVNFFTPIEKFDSVDEYNERAQLCHV